MNKIKCPYCFTDMRPMLDRIGAMKNLHVGNRVLCDCGKSPVVDDSIGDEFSLAKSTVQ